MNTLSSWYVDRKIWVRVTLSAVLVAVVVGGSFLIWAARAQHQAAVQQAEDFATSVHQMTMAGLTGMMITGTIDQRLVFLEQIEESDHVTAVRVVRADAVIDQYGLGHEGETAADSVEAWVLATGEPSVAVLVDGDRERLRAVLPTPASDNYLGKNCLTCHTVEPGTVLGAVSVEISLDEARASAASFNRRSAIAALLLAIPFCVLIWFAVERTVSRPLRRLTSGLRRIAEGDIKAQHRLVVRGRNEIGEAKEAFNLVMDRAIEMLRAERIYRTVFEHSTEAITVTDGDGRITAVNPAFERTTGYEAREALGETPALLKSGRHDGEFYERFWSKLLKSGEWSGEIWNKRKDGSIYPESLSVVAVQNPSGATEHFIGMFSDITDRKLREEQMEYQAFHDNLTGLPNRGAFMERIRQAVALARRHDHPAPSIMYMDMDGFKWINDNLGHDAGDAVLVEFARRVEYCVRESDTVARLGGDEFTVLLPETSDEAGVLRVAAKVLEALEEPMEFDGRPLNLGVSIGTATFPMDGEDADELMRSADAAMYRSKQAGGGCVALEHWRARESQGA